MNTELDWHPIEDLPANWRDLADPGTPNLVQSWNEEVETLRQLDEYDRFMKRLRRQWAIETGVLERLYYIEESATKILIEHGLDASLLGPGDTDRPGEDAAVVALIKDQEAAIDSMYAFIAQGRRLTVGYIKQLHAVLTAHQATAEGIDPEGRTVYNPLLRGEWKRESNSIQQADGRRVSFIPPSLVEANMLNILDWHERHQIEGVPADVESAWLHHRFTLIHPFQDGNGRMARCLATLVLMRARWFPLVVTRHERGKYIEGLRAADDGDLGPLVRLFNELQRRDIRRARDLGRETMEASADSPQGMLPLIRDRLRDRATAHARKYRTVDQTADVLRTKIVDRLKEVANEATALLSAVDSTFYPIVDTAANGDDRDHYYWIQIVEAAKAYEYFANRSRYKSWAVLALLTANQRAEILFSFHGVGRDSRGVLCCSPSFCQKELDREDAKIVKVERLADAPFDFTYKDDPFEVAARFGPWLEEVLKTGLARWSTDL